VTEATPEEKPSRWRRLVGESRTMLTATIALIAGAVGLLFALVPSLKPDPRENVGAAIEVFAVEPHVSLREWAQEASPKDVKGAYERQAGVRNPAPDQLDYPGTIIYVRVEVDGYKHRTVALRGSLYRTRTQQRVDVFGSRDTLRSTVSIDSPSRRSVQLIRLPDISQDTDPQFVRVELVDSDSGTILAVADSPTLVRGRIQR
jgi:hypothetical protein